MSLSLLNSKSRLISIVLILNFLSSLALHKNSYFKMSREVISTPLSPLAIGPYSQAIKAGGVLYASGCLGLNPATMKLVDGGVGPQTRQVLTNLKNIIEAGGGKMSNTAKVIILLTDMSFFAEVNAIYAEFFPSEPPARMTYAVAGLPLGALVEIDATVPLLP